MAPKKDLKSKDDESKLIVDCGEASGGTLDPAINSVEATINGRIYLIPAHLLNSITPMPTQSSSSWQMPLPTRTRSPVRQTVQLDIPPRDTKAIMNFVAAVGWKFNNKKDKVDEFLEKVDRIAMSFGLNDNMLIRAIPLMLDGPAYDFFFLEKDKWITYVEIKEDFIKRFSEDYYEERLEDSVRERKQGENEPATNYIEAILKIYRQMPCPPSESIQVERIFRNLHPDYVPFLHSHRRCNNMKEFRRHAVNADQALAIANGNDQQEDTGAAQ